MKRFSLSVDLSGGSWTACWSDDWDVILQESIKWAYRKMRAYDRQFASYYDFNSNEWRKY